MKSTIETVKRVAEVKATYHSNEPINLTTINSSQQVNSLIREVFPVDIQHREAFIALFLNRANQILGYSIISIGGISSTLVDPKLIFQHALLCNASQFIVAHNHPSGKLNPSNQDLSVTRRLQQVGELMELPLIDHLIISNSGYKSFADEGLL
ncbi:JAB domain-containing protein [Reichenbachiella ulvae]|uniref:JAB domain-containing protein n=1 Tax=Reichenbachiella ulvae TaxID=2980104 RepID=A0ABT3CWI6_9BACT|nr:JAB domain-containing protein [Reichenbachiella ulvae]MCV9388070.1 JAB domain-containing protein [Reichenbachiella ulvae]